MRTTVVDTVDVTRTVALVVLMGPQVDVAEDLAQSALNAAKTRTVYSTLVAKGRLTVQYHHNTDGYRVTLDA